VFRKLLQHALSSPSVIGMIVAFITLLGIVSVSGLKTDLFPSLNFPILNVVTELPSFSSIEMERQVTLPVESAAGGTLGVIGVRSTSATGISMVSVEFQWGTDMLTARQLLIEALAQIRAQLPQGSEPVIENLSATLSMIEGYSFRGGRDPVAFRDGALFDLKPKLQRVPGVYKVVVMGGKILEYTVRPNPLLLVKYDLTLQNLKDGLTANNILATPGIVNHFSQELVMHANGQFANESEIRDVVVAVKNGIAVHLGDVAQVERAYEYERGDATEKGEPAVLINVYKQPGFDTGEVADAVAKEIRSYQEGAGKGFTISNYYDQAELVRNSIGSVKESVWIGAILVVLVLALFLREWRTTLIATLSIPISVLSALILIRVFGIGLNIMSLGGLAIGTGIIVDDAIVVLENIHRWLATPSLRGTLERGEVVLRAASEVVRPVVVSTLTNIGIFAPMVFVEGFAGRLFQPVSLTVTFALVASLVVALTVIPVLSSRFLVRVTNEPESGGLLQKAYRHPLAFALRRPKTVLLIALIPVMGVAWLATRLETEFLPSLDEGAVLLQTIMPPGTSLPESRRVGMKIENWLKQIPGVVTVTRRTGHAPGAEDTDNVNHSDIMIKLVPKGERPLPLDQFIDALKAKTSPLASVQVNYLMPLADKINDALGGVPADIGIDLFGPDLPVLRTQAQKLIEGMKSVAGLTDLRPPTDIPVPSLEILIHRKEAGRLGITEQSIYDTLQAYSAGLPATSVREVQKEIKVVLRFVNPGVNVDLDLINGLQLKTAGGSTVPLEQVAHLSYGEIPSEIYHEQMSRKLTVTANVQGRKTGDVAADLQRLAQGLKLPSGYFWRFAGKYRSEQSALKNMAMVLGLAVLMVAAILWLEFRSWVEVALILLTIPLAAVGGLLSLWLFRQTLNVSSMIGAVMLVGIVVRNGIMLLDYMNAGRREGKPLSEAIEQAARKRVRPILMTASVTILGLLPIAVGWGTGSELLRPLAIAVIGGLLTSTLLTLVVLPAASRSVARWIS
jgi:CzcA family heavy metal efflux pump